MIVYLIAVTPLPLNMLLNVARLTFAARLVTRYWCCSAGEHCVTANDAVDVYLRFPLYDLPHAYTLRVGYDVDVCYTALR